LKGSPDGYFAASNFSAKSRRAIENCLEVCRMPPNAVGTRVKMKLPPLSRRSLLKLSTVFPCLPWLEACRAKAETPNAPREVGRSTINANLGGGDLYMNLAKGFSVGSKDPVFARSFDQDQYPQGLLKASLDGNFPFPRSYFGRLIWKWRGQGSLQFLALPAIIYGGGASVVGVNASSADVSGNITIKDKMNPRVEFAWGWKIQSLSQSSVSNAAGGYLVRLTSKPGYLGNVQNNATIKIQAIRGQANALGVWKCTKIDNQTFDLQGSTWNSADPYGGPSGEALLSVGQVSLSFPPGTYSAFRDLTLCRSADEAAIEAGLQISQAAINSYAALNPKYLRFMDMLAVINSTATNFRYRPRPTAMTYGAGRIEPAYWVGRLVQGANDAYACGNPAASGRGAYLDGETIQGYADLANLTAAPTLNVGGRGAKPIFGIDVTPQLMTLTGTPTPGDVISLVFTASHINGGTPYVFQYTVNASSGRYGPDVNIDKLGANLTFAAGRDAALVAAGISFGNAGQGRCSIIYNRNASGGTAFSASVSGAATEVVTFGTIKPGAITANGTRTYTYSAILDGWIQNHALNSGAPLEVIAEICNRCNVGCWVNIPLLYSIDSATEFGATLAGLLHPGLPLVCEVSNEIWNFGQFQTHMAVHLGSQLGFAGDAHGGYNSFHALRDCQLLPAFASGWTGAGRSRSHLKLITANTILEGDGHYSGRMQQFGWNGADLDVTKNATLAALGGPGGTPLSTGYNVFPNRPIDLVDGVSYALYWKGALARSTSSDWNGAQSSYDSLFQASADFAAGGSGVARALAAWDDDIRRGTKNGKPGSATISSFAAPQRGYETKLREYDGPRAKAGMSKLGVYVYEAALEQGLGSNGVNGTNSIDATDLERQFAGNRWTLFPTYSSSNLEVATNLVKLFLAYKNSDYFANNVTALFTQVTTIHEGREAYPAWYGYTGPNIWALFPGDITSQPYKSYGAIAAFNRQA
jgi:hypothetical protein